MQAFVEVEKCERALCEYDAIEMVFWITDASKSKKATIATNSLVETQPQKTLHCCRSRESSHTKNDPNCLNNLKKKGQSTEKPK